MKHSPYREGFHTWKSTNCSLANQNSELTLHRRQTRRRATTTTWEATTLKKATMKTKWSTRWPSRSLMWSGAVATMLHLHHQRRLRHRRVQLPPRAAPSLPFSRRQCCRTRSQLISTCASPPFPAHNHQLYLFCLWYWHHPHTIYLICFCNNQ